MILGFFVRRLFRFANVPLLALITGVLVFGGAAGECTVTKEEAADEASELATAAAKTAVALTRERWHEPVENPVIGPWGPEDGDHQNADREAIDYIGEAGTPVFAMASGVVAFAGKNCETKDPNAATCYGTAVAIEHANGIYSVYTHLAEVSGLERGDDVTRETQIGLMGETGCKESTNCGVHLHFVVRKNDKGVAPATALFEGTPVPIRDGKLKPR